MHNGRNGVPRNNSVNSGIGWDQPGAESGGSPEPWDVDAGMAGHGSYSATGPDGDRLLQLCCGTTIIWKEPRTTCWNHVD